MELYSLMYRLGIRPWERYGAAAAGSIAALLDREKSERPRPLGRALDLGRGRGQFTLELARRGWQAVGVDLVPAVIEAAKSRVTDGATYVVGDVTELEAADLGTFDLFLDIGCFQGLDPDQRPAVGRGVSALANPGATLLILAFGPSRWGTAVGAASREDVETAFGDWQLLVAEPADTARLGWPMNRTAPQWFRLRRRYVGRLVLGERWVGSGRDVPGRRDAGSRAPWRHPPVTGTLSCPEPSLIPSTDRLHAPSIRSAFGLVAPGPQQHAPIGRSCDRPLSRCRQDFPHAGGNRAQLGPAGEAVVGGCDTQTGVQIGFPGSGWAEQHSVAGLGQEVPEAIAGIC
jgi:SAM-dependent methyltransferase